jgi:hypothetical protein
MKTKDFSGEYDYERGEAQNEAAYFLETILPEYDLAGSTKYVAKIAAHWKVVLGDRFSDFKDEWNKLVSQFPL